MALCNGFGIASILEVILGIIIKDTKSVHQMGYIIYGQCVCTYIVAYVTLKLEKRW